MIVSSSSPSFRWAHITSGASGGQNGLVPNSIMGAWGASAVVLAPLVRLGGFGLDGCGGAARTRPEGGFALSGLGGRWDWTVQTDVLLGSTHYVTQLADQPPPLFAVVWDMVADRDVAPS